MAASLKRLPWGYQNGRAREPWYRPARGDTVKVLAPGIGAAVRAHLAAHGMTRAALAAEVGLSVPQIGRVSAGNGVVSLAIYDALAAILPCPYTVDHCKLSERPGGPVRQSSPVDDRNYSFRRKAWPALDDFAGLPGGWC